MIALVLRLAVVAMLISAGIVAESHAQTCGDADDSGGDPTVTDGVNVLRAAAELTSPCTLARCDVDGDGQIGLTDGVNVLRDVADLPAIVLCGPDPIISSVSDDVGTFGEISKLPTGLVAPPNAVATITNVEVANTSEVVPGRVNTVTVSYDVGAVQAQGVDGDLGLIVASALADGSPSPNVFSLPVRSSQDTVTLAITLRDDLGVQNFRLRFANSVDGLPIGLVETVHLAILQSVAPQCGNRVLERDETCEPPEKECSVSPAVGGICDANCQCMALPGPTPTPISNGRFVDNGDGTVTDLTTGLQWERKNTAFGSGKNPTFPHDVDNIYSWSDSVSEPDGTVFTSFLARLTPFQNCFAGLCDWRLPELQELKTIVDLGAPGCGNGAACIFPIFGPTAPKPYWTNTTPIGSLENAWFVSFAGGTSFKASKRNEFFARAVRTAGPPNPP